MNHYPFVSVIISTYNRHNIICNTVNHMLKQDYPNYEIIVVDQTENIPAHIKSFFDKLSNKDVLYIRISEMGLPNARNVGINVSNGEIIIFVDDDIKPFDEHFIRKHAENYSNPEIVGVSGRIVDPEFPLESDPQQILKLTKWGTILGGKNGIVRTETDVLSGGNMSFRKIDALKSGLFDTDIIGTAQGEEISFSLKLLKNSGKKFVFDPTATLYHYALSSGGCHSRSVPPLYRHFCRFYNHTLICLKNKDRINPFFFLFGRIAAMLLIAVKSRNLKVFYWLTLAIYYGNTTYRKKINPKHFFEKVEERLGVRVKQRGKI